MLGEGTFDKSCVPKDLEVGKVIGDDDVLFFKLSACLVPPSAM